MVSDEAHQCLVMNAIYAVKAGNTEGINLEEFRLALAHIINAGAELVILGCTELPLLSARIEMNRESIPMLDPGEILARKCVEICQGAT